MIKCEAEVTTVGNKFYSLVLRAFEEATGKKESPNLQANIFRRPGLGDA